MAVLSYRNIHRSHMSGNAEGRRIKLALMEKYGSREAAITAGAVKP